MLYVNIAPCPCPAFTLRYPDNDKHSHEIGEANLLFTRRGRKAAQEKGKLSSFRANPIINGSSQATTTSPTTVVATTATTTNPASAVTSSLHNGNGATTHHNAIAGPSSVPHDPNISPALQHPHHPLPGISPHHTHGSLSSAAISILAPLPPPAPTAPQPADASQERWDRMGVLFASIRQHARGFEYPGPSVAALESVLIRLYLESPLGGGMGPGGLSGPSIHPLGDGGPES